MLGEDNEIRLETTTRMESPKNLVYEFTSPNAGEIVSAGDIIEYVLTITNIGESGADIRINGQIADVLPEGLIIIPGTLSYRVNDGEDTLAMAGFNRMSVPGGVQLEQHDTVEVRIMAEVMEEAEEGEISKSARITEIVHHDEIITNSVSHIISTENEIEGPGDELFTISGIAWLDENGDGLMGENDTRIANIPVRIRKGGAFVTDSEGRELEAITDNQGRFEFTGLEPGSYIVVFGVDTSIYRLTSGNVSRAISVPEGGRIIFRADVTIVDANATNVHIGLVENEVFDLALNKYISRVTIRNEDGETHLDRDNVTGNFVRMDIRARAIQGTAAVINYRIVVTNEGEVAGNVKSIIDYMPPTLIFSSELNPNWHRNTDGNLIYTGMADERILPGESRTANLVLTTTVTTALQGYSIVNAAAIHEYENDNGIANAKGNDRSEATVQFAVATGGVAMYVSIVIACMVILSAGIYFINKKVLVTGRGDA